MKFHVVVHNPHLVPIAQEVEFKGETARAAFDGFECELLATDGVSGSFKLRTVSKADTAAALALFTADRKITVTLEANADAEGAAVPAAV